MKSVLVSKLLTPAQKGLLINAGVGMVEWDAIKKQPIEFELPLEPFDSLIFTSSFAIQHFFSVCPPNGFTAKKVFCVGSKSASLLKEYGLQVLEVAKNAEELGQIIGSHHKAGSFLFCTGNLRRQELPLLLKENNIRYKEIIVYRTSLHPKSFDQEFDGILFFSPSAVESFTAKNNMGTSVAFCIGPTTAREAQKHTQNIIISNKPTVENVIVQVVKYFKEDHSFKPSKDYEIPPY